jgi:TPR repeat protein
MRSVSVSLVLASLCVVHLWPDGARAQDENPTTPGAIPNPGTYQGSMELQRRSDEQDQQFRQQQQQQQQSQQPYQQQPQRPYPGGQPGARQPSAPPQQAPAYQPKVMPDFAVNQKAGAALERGDYAAGLHILQPLVQRGDMVAQYQMALVYERGAGVAKNFAAARQLYEKSAAQGFPAAMLNLGVMYGQGLGGPVDDIQAYRWFSLAIPRLYAPQQADPRKQAVHDRDFVAARMTKAQVTQAEALARATSVPFIR